MNIITNEPVKVDLEPREVSLVFECAKRRELSSMLKKSKTHVGNEKATFFAHLIGSAGEYAFCKHFNLFWSADYDTYKSEPDVYYKSMDFEIRTRTKKWYDLKIDKRDSIEQRFVLCYADKPLDFVLLQGWIDGETGKDERYIKDYGDNNVPNYFFPKDKLNPIQTALDGINDIN